VGGIEMYCPECRKEVDVLERTKENDEAKSINVWCTECKGLLYGRYIPNVKS